MLREIVDAFKFGSFAASSSPEGDDGVYATGDSVTIPDAHLIFSGHYSRAGQDLVLADDAHKKFVVHDYFAPGKRASLVAPDGAALTADVVELLAGSPDLKYAQASAPQPCSPRNRRLQHTAAAVRLCPIRNRSRWM